MPGTHTLAFYEHLVLPANIILGRKDYPGANALVYKEHLQVKDIKSFITLDPYHKYHSRLQKLARDTLAYFQHFHITDVRLWSYPQILDQAGRAYQVLITIAY